MSEIYAHIQWFILTVVIQENIIGPISEYVVEDIINSMLLPHSFVALHS